MDFADIKLLECNRTQSIQAKSGNDTQPAVFTCKLGKGVKLDAGDTVEILSGFVSEDGCGGDNMEFNGDFLKTDNGYLEDGTESRVVKVDLEYTKLLITHNSELIKDFQHKQSVIVRNEKDGTNTNSTATYTLKDNETNVPQRYYKNNNGEGTLYLPRRFTMNYSTQLNPFAKAAADPANPARQYPMAVFYECVEDLNNGVNQASIATSLTHANGGLPTDTFKQSKTDKFLYTSGGYATYWDGANAPTLTNQYWKPKTDNKRFTMFIKAKNYNNYDAAPNLPDGTNYLKDQAGRLDPIATEDYIEYIEIKTYKAAVGFNSPSNVAGQITEQMQQTVEYTDSEGRLQTQPEKLELDIKFAGQTAEQPYEVFSATTTNSYFPIESGGMGRNDNETFTDVEVFHNEYKADNSKEPTDQQKESIARYFGTYQYIFIKRPEIFIAGRKLNNYICSINTNTTGGETKGFITKKITQLNPAANVLQTSWEWNNTNLDNLSKLFKAQGPYVEELGLGEDRFLHIACQPESATTDNTFGWDGYTAQTPVTNAGGGAKADDYPTTAPIIFRYDKDKENIYNDGLDGTENMCYGFATRARNITLENGTVADVIVLHPELARSINLGVGGGFGVDGLFNGQPVDPNNTDNGEILANTTYVGWDWHGNSFGQVIMSSMNGHAYGPPYSMLDTTITSGGTVWPDNATATSSINMNSVLDYAIQNKTPNSEPYSNYDNNGVRITPFLNFRYIGANDPALIFDPTSNSFGFQSLHTAEKINQPADAGRTTTVKITSGGVDSIVPTTVPIDEGAATECYKINKRLRYNDYTPDMKPYNVKYPQKLPYVADTTTDKLPVNMSTMEKGGAFALNLDASTTDIAQANDNIEKGVIFDQHTGIFLDIGATCPKRYWKKSFWGLLGFTYEQFHPEDISDKNNQQIRVGEGNMFSMKYAATNCQVVSADLLDYPITQFGGINYSTQIAAPIVVQSYGTDVTKSFSMNYQPYIVQNTTSIITRAETIPKLMTRPYYTIRSDILDDSKYIGGSHGGLKLSLLGVVNKINGEGDYYFTDSGGMSFTITNPITLTDITTAICDPDGSLSKVNDNSAVIYKITKQMNTDKFNIVKQIMQQEAQAKK